MIQREELAGNKTARKAAEKKEKAGEVQPASPTKRLKRSGKEKVVQTPMQESTLWHARLQANVRQC